MSEMEFRKGTIKELFLDIKEMQDKLSALEKQEGKTLSELNIDNSDDEYIDFYGSEYMGINGRLFKIIKNENMEYDEVNEIKQDEDDKNTYHFLSRFYNGGTCLKEQLEYLL